MKHPKCSLNNEWSGRHRFKHKEYTLNKIPRIIGLLPMGQNWSNQNTHLRSVLSISANVTNWSSMYFIRWLDPLLWDVIYLQENNINYIIGSWACNHSTKASYTVTNHCRTMTLLSYLVLHTLIPVFLWKYSSLATIISTQKLTIYITVLCIETYQNNYAVFVQLPNKRWNGDLELCFLHIVLF